MPYRQITLAAALLALAGCTANDSEITRSVQARLTRDGVTDQVHVSTERRVVHLEGVVADMQELNRAEMDARLESGILGVDNRLVVQHSVNLTGATMNQSTPAGPIAPVTPVPTMAP